MVQELREPETCRQCGCPMAGNENYCSSCGRRVDAIVSHRRLVFTAAALILLSLAMAATCLQRRFLPEPRAGPIQPALPPLTR
jgi:multidrug efflux pump subunit AcrB